MNALLNLLGYYNMSIFVLRMGDWLIELIWALKMRVEIGGLCDMFHGIWAECPEDTQLIKEIESALNVKVIDLMLGLAIDKYGREVRIGRMISRMKESNRELKIFKESLSHEFETRTMGRWWIEATTDPIDILSMSEGQEWSSCTKISGSGFLGVITDIAVGSVVLYYYEEDSNKRIGREILRPGVSSKGACLIRTGTIYTTRSGLPHITNEFLSDLFGINVVTGSIQENGGVNFGVYDDFEKRKRPVAGRNLYMEVSSLSEKWEEYCVFTFSNEMKDRCQHLLSELRQAEGQRMSPPSQRETNKILGKIKCRENVKLFKFYRPDSFFMKYTRKDPGSQDESNINMIRQFNDFIG